MQGARLLHVTPYSADAWAYGGIPRVVAAQTAELANRGAAVTVVTTDACGAERLPAAPGARRLCPHPPALQAGVEVLVFPNLSNWLAFRRQLFLPLGLADYLDRHLHGFRLAHLHGYHHLPGAIAARRLRRAGIPYVLQPNGTAPRIERRRTAKLLFDLTFGRGVLSGAAAVIAVSAAEQRVLERLGVPAEQITVIPNPLSSADLAALPQRGSFRRRHRLDRPLVLYLGQLGPRKRVDLVLRAVARLHDPGVQLVIAGSDMGCETALRRLAANLGLGERALFAGVLRGGERLEALADADVVVYPAQHEVFGLVPMEALLSGTPVVVADDCGCGEIIRRLGGGLVVASGEVDSLARAIADILAERQAWVEPVEAAAAAVRELFSPAAVGGQLEVLYRRLTQRPEAA